MGNKLCNAWEKQQANPGKDGPSLLKAGLQVFKGPLMLSGIILLLLEIFVRGSQPLFIMGVVSYFSGYTEDIKLGYLYALGLILCSLFNVLIVHPIMLYQSHLGMKIRIAAISMIYRKTLRLTLNALGETTAGQVVNLLSNDVGRFETSILFIHYLWIAPIQLICVSIILYLAIGWSAFIGVGFIILFVPLQSKFILIFKLFI